MNHFTATNSYFIYGLAAFVAHNLSSKVSALLSFCVFLLLELWCGDVKNKTEGSESHQ